MAPVKTIKSEEVLAHNIAKAVAWPCPLMLREIT